MSEPSTPSREWSSLLAACSTLPSSEKLKQLRDAFRHSVNQDQLFALADRHGVQPLLYNALCDLPEIPDEQRRVLKTIHEANLHKALLLSRELIRIVDHLSGVGVQVMPYKGLALAEMLYGDIAARQAGDLDMLIQATDLSRAREALLALGYKQHVSFSQAEEREYVKFGYELAFDGVSGPNLLELQWAFQPRFYAVDFDMKGMFNRAIEVSVAGRMMKSPSHADLLLTLSVHAAKHAWGRLIWICDIARLLQCRALEWNWIQMQAEQLGIARILCVTMILANRLLQEPIPQSGQAFYARDSQAFALADEIVQSLLSGTSFNTESPSYFRLMMRLRERPLDRWRFFQRLTFTPGPGEWQAIRLRRPGSPLYRLVRLTRLAARLVRA
jgi:hypothetical protein